MAGQIPPGVKKARYRRAMMLQQKIAAEIAAAKVGSRMRVLVDQPLVARGLGDAPEVDTKILLDRPAPVGSFTEVLVTGAQVYDLRARVL
jgi:ribosomal protein S12 methylthiotransferase